MIPPSICKGGRRGPVPRHPVPLGRRAGAGPAVDLGRNPADERAVAIAVGVGARRERIQERRQRGKSDRVKMYRKSNASQWAMRRFTGEWMAKRCRSRRGGRGDGSPSPAVRGFQGSFQRCRYLRDESAFGRMVLPTASPKGPTAASLLRFLTEQLRFALIVSVAVKVTCRAFSDDGILQLLGGDISKVPGHGVRLAPAYLRRNGTYISCIPGFGLTSFQDSSFDCNILPCRFFPARSILDNPVATIARSFRRRLSERVCWSRQSLRVAAEVDLFI